MKKLVLLIFCLVLSFSTFAMTKPKFCNQDPNTFATWVTERLVYPEIAKKSYIQGIVIVQFTVNAVGRVVNTKILKSVDAVLDKEALRVVSMSPKWQPARWRGKRLETHYILPIKFVLT